MKRSVSEFNQDGINAFAALIERERSRVASTAPAKVGEEFFQDVDAFLTDDDLVDVLDPESQIDGSKVFTDRFEFGAYLDDQLPADISQVQYTNSGLWAWISAVYLRQLLEQNDKDGQYRLWSLYRYIPLEYNKRRYYRHLAFLPFWMHRTMGERVARFFMSLPVHVGSDAVEQLYTQEHDFVTTPSLIEASIDMYLDQEKMTLRRNALGVKTPGSARRLATIIAPQLQMNFDMRSMSKEQVLNLLPTEFDQWQED
jgi:hypothetical protein